jgi:hypothetical protein
MKFGMEVSLGTQTLCFSKFAILWSLKVEKFQKYKNSSLAYNSGFYAQI